MVWIWIEGVEEREKTQSCISVFWESFVFKQWFFVGFLVGIMVCKNTLIVYYRSETILMNKSSSLDFMFEVLFVCCFLGCLFCLGCVSYFLSSQTYL